MNDYEELIDKLRFYADTADDPIYGICINSPKVMFQAADAIEHLIKERDAAVADLTDTATHGECVACKHFDNSDSVFCQECRLHSESKWEWRGVG